MEVHSTSSLGVLFLIICHIDPAGEIAETRVGGYTTDETATIQVFAIDVDRCTGEESERLLGSVVPRPAGRQGQWQLRADMYA